VQEPPETGANTSTGKNSPQPRTYLLIFIVVLLAILNGSCYRYFSDGIQFAVELRYSTDWILHPHHVLYPLLPQVFYRVFGFDRSGLGELGFLIGWSKAMYLFSSIAMLYILRRCGFGLSGIVIGLILFMISHGVWYFGLTANQNSTPLLFHLLTLIAIQHVYLQKKPLNLLNILLVTLLIAVSTLASQVNAVLLLPFIYVLFVKSESGKGRTRNILLFILFAILILILLLIAIGSGLGGFSSFTDYVNWQYSYVFQNRWWSGSFQDGLLRNLKGLFTVHVAEIFSTWGLFGDWTGEFGAPAWWYRLVLRLGQAFAAIALLNEFIRTCIDFIRRHVRKPVQTIGLLAALPILIFSIFYIPENLNLRVLYIPGFILFILPSIEQRYRFDNRPGLLSMTGWPVKFGLIALLLVNLLTFYWPCSTPACNPRLDEMVVMAEHVERNDFVIYPWTDEGHTDALYVQYFLDTEALTINKLIDIEREYGGAATREILTTSEGERTIWLHEDVINTELMGGQYGSTVSSDEVAQFINRFLSPQNAGFSSSDVDYTAYSIIDLTADN